MELVFIGQIIGLYKMVLLVRIIVTWIPHNPNNSVALFLYKITEPVLEPARRIIPSIGGIDISPIVIFFGLGFLQRAFS